MSKTKYKLDNVAINDVLPLKAARRDAIANLKCFGASDTRDQTSMVTFTFSMRRHLIRLASAPCISSRLATFGWARFRVQPVGSTMQNLRRVGENSDLILSRLWIKVHEISDDVGSPLYFQTLFSDCLCHVSYRRYSPLSLEIVEKRSKCKNFLAPNFLWEGRLRLFYGNLLGRLTMPITWQSLVEFRLLISVC